MDFSWFKNVLYRFSHTLTKLETSDRDGNEQRRQRTDTKFVKRMSERGSKWVTSTDSHKHTQPKNISWRCALLFTLIRYICIAIVHSSVCTADAVNRGNTAASSVCTSVVWFYNLLQSFQQQKYIERRVQHISTATISQRLEKNTIFCLVK